MPNVGVRILSWPFLLQRTSSRLVVPDPLFAAPQCFPCPLVSMLFDKASLRISASEMKNQRQDRKNAKQRCVHENEIS